ncbi:hypothetical protein QBC37DRAFT_433185 [Rhypophila decipiens]|uniref:Uncharacterized protein n=1 Tax=Rhypophila decipiens TaxID=261697 RepID=A0AAN6XXW9_9PEZI|nr:hypothetical protein QBC37DRAFT_433185 [Rhypophila decipiens]
MRRYSPIWHVLMCSLYLTVGETFCSPSLLRSVAFKLKPRSKGDNAPTLRQSWVSQSYSVSSNDSSGMADSQSSAGTHL